MRGEDCKLRLLKEGTKKMNLGKTANILFQEASSEYKWYFAEDWRILKVLKEEWKPKRLRLRRWRVAEEEWSGRSTDSCPLLLRQPCQWRSSSVLASPVLCTFTMIPTILFWIKSLYSTITTQIIYIESFCRWKYLCDTRISTHFKWLLTYGCSPSSSWSQELSFSYSSFSS